MKKLLFILSAVAAFSVLISGISLAEPTHPNEVGLYMTPDGYGESGTYVQDLPVEVYLVLTKPTDEMSGLPYSNIRAFECQLNFNPVGGLFLLGASFQGDALNIGDTNNFAAGYLEYIVGTASDWPVVDEAVVLVTFTFLNSNDHEVAVSLGPVSAPSIPGQMAFVSYDFQPTLIPMYPISGSLDDPVFLFNGIAVPVENESFGSVKALYR